MVVVFQKIKCEILAHKDSQTTRATPGDCFASWNRKPIGQRDLLAPMTMDQDFPGKVSHFRHVWSHGGALRRTPAWSSASTSRFHKGIFFFIWQWYPFFLSLGLFFFPFFFSRTFFRIWFFHKQRAFPYKFFKVRDVNKIWKKHENRAPTWAVTTKILPGDSSRSEIVTSSWYIDFYFKNVFLNNSGAFKDFRHFFYGDLRFKVWI